MWCRLSKDASHPRLQPSEQPPRFPQSSVALLCPPSAWPQRAASFMGKRQAHGLDQSPELGTLNPRLCHVFSSVQSLRHVRLCDPMDCSTPGFPVRHQFLGLSQTHVHRVTDTIQASSPLLSPSPPAFNLSQHQGLL